MTDFPSNREPAAEARPDSPTGSSGSDASGDLDALVSRLQVIEGQPLAQRAPAYGQLHDELRAALEGADASA